VLAIGCAAMLAPGVGAVFAQDPAAEKPAAEKPAVATPAAATPAAAVPDTAKAPVDVKIPAEQLDSLVAPIALYPDALLAQTLVASTYPLEIIQLHQWLAKHPDMKDQALADAVAQQPWDPSIQSMAAIPDVVKRLADDVQWTTDLGNAFLGQQQDVMDAVQRMRKKAKDNGALESNEQMVVKTETVESNTVIIVESTDPEIIYVPVYTPTVVYGAPIYPYPPIYYPPYPPGGAFITFSMGVMWGAAWGGSCCGCGWHGGGGGGNIYINNSNNFNQINHNRGGQGGSGNWNHNPQHRGGAPYASQNTANKYGGATRGSGSKAGGAGVSNTAAGGAGNRGGAGVSNNAAGGAGNKSGSAARPSGGSKVGNQTVPKNNPSKSDGSLSGGSSGYNGNAARAQSSRGASSGGGRSGGGSRGGGSRGGGGRR
jgi:hypothetical protein